MRKRVTLEKQTDLKNVTARLRDIFTRVDLLTTFSDNHKNSTMIQRFKWIFQNASELIIDARCMNWNENHCFRSKTAMISVNTDFQSWNSCYQNWESLVITENYWASPNTCENIWTLLKMSGNCWIYMKISGFLWKCLNIAGGLN